MTNFGKVSTNVTELRESPLLWIEGVDTWVDVQIDGSGTIASPTMLLYENGTDVSGTLLTGTMSISGRVIKTKTFQNLVGGNHYIAYISYTDDAVAQMRELHIVVPKLGVPPSQYPAAFDTLKVDESPILVYPSQSYLALLVVEGYGDIGSVTMSAYKKTKDVSADILSGTASVSGRSITMKTISGLSGNSSYLVYIFFTDGGKQTCRYLEIICPKLGA